LLHFMLAFAAERAVKGFFAGRAFFLGHGGNALLVSESCRDDNQIKNGVFPSGKRRFAALRRSGALADHLIDQTIVLG
ncbi:hypothetical protein J8J07_24385, partial [Mycobacterium tuberculosis]|nr:hypothetical protein [Mycobacterium tuberculosis]